VTPCSALVAYQYSEILAASECWYPTTTQRHNPDGLDLKHHRRESLNIRIVLLFAYFAIPFDALGNRALKRILTLSDYACQ